MMTNTTTMMTKTTVQAAARKPRPRFACLTGGGTVAPSLPLRSLGLFSACSRGGQHRDDGNDHAGGGSA
jgi:hypothetical protein